MSAEDAAPAKAEAAVQVWPGLLPLTVAHRPAGLYLEGSSRTPGTPEASCDAAGLLRARRSPETDARACGRAICLRVESWSGRNPGPLRRSCTLTCNVPTGFSDVLCIQVKTYASSFRTRVLIGVAAALCAVVKDGCWREGGASPTSTKALVTSAYGSACPPQWLPVLLTFNSRHDDSPTSPLATLSTWQCNPQDGSVSQNGVTVDASVPCNWGLTRDPTRQPAGRGDGQLPVRGQRRQPAPGARAPRRWPPSRRRRWTGGTFRWWWCGTTRTSAGPTPSPR